MMDFKKYIDREDVEHQSIDNLNYDWFKEIKKVKTENVLHGGSHEAKKHLTKFLK